MGKLDRELEILNTEVTKIRCVVHILRKQKAIAQFKSGISKEDENIIFARIVPENSTQSI